MNPDGVDLGHWRHNAGGIDLNRDWSVYNQKEIKTTVDFISKTLKENNSKTVWFEKVRERLPPSQSME